MNPQGHIPPSASVGAHEGAGLDVRLIRRVACVIAVILVLIIFALLALFDHLNSKYSARTSEASPRVALADLPPVPRPQADPLQDLQAVRAKEDDHLAKYAWVDRQHGVARIPIDRAMTLWLQNYSAVPPTISVVPVSPPTPPSFTELKVRQQKGKEEPHVP